MAREECSSVLVVAVPGQLGAGTQDSVPRTASDLPAEPGDTGPCAVTPQLHMQVL